MLTVGYRHMMASGRGGKIVLVASISGHRVNYPQPQAAYNVSKAALLHMKNSLAAEWTRYGIRVNSISPGYMDTVLNAGEALAPWRRVWAERNPMRRMGAPQELTGPVVFLCSEMGASYVNGADIVVDGLLSPAVSVAMLTRHRRRSGLLDRSLDQSVWWAWSFCSPFLSRLSDQPRIYDHSCCFSGSRIRRTTDDVDDCRE